MNDKITIEKLPNPEHSGDWHDAPLRWIVKGPGTETQKFATKAHATLYRRCRRQSLVMGYGQGTAISAYVSLP